MPAQNLHLTLAFIGEYRDPEQVKQILASVPLPAFRLALSEKGNFGNILMGRSKGKSETENLCQRSAGGSEECRHSPLRTTDLLPILP